MLKKYGLNNGITLISIVITIIVILILAAVTISLFINGGIIDKATEAKRVYKLSQFKEQVVLDIADVVSKLYSEKIEVNLKTVVNELVKEDGEYNYKLKEIYNYDEEKNSVRSFSNTVDDIVIGKTNKVSVEINGGVAIIDNNLYVEVEGIPNDNNGGTINPPVIPEPNPPIVYLPFDEIGESSNKNYLTDSVSGENFTIKAGSITENNTKKVFGNQSLYFAPSSGAQRINKSIPNMNFGTKDFTISFWAYGEGVQSQNYEVLFSFDTNSINNFCFYTKDNAYNSGKMSLAGTRRRCSLNKM